RLQVLEQVAQQFQISLRGDVFEQIGATAHDQPRRRAAFGAGPDSQTTLDQILRELVEGRLRLLLHPRDLGARLGQRAAPYVRVEEIRGLVQLRSGDASGQVDDPVLDLAVLRDENRQRL